MRTLLPLVLLFLFLTGPVSAHESQPGAAIGAASDGCRPEHAQQQTAAEYGQREARHVAVPVGHKLSAALHEAQHRKEGDYIDAQRRG